MSLLSAVSSAIKELIGKLIRPKTIESVLNITPAISAKMTDAIELWGKMYQDEAPWLKESENGDESQIKSLGIPALICSSLATTALIEAKSEITTPFDAVEEDNPDYTPPILDEFGNPVSSGQPKTIIKEVPKSDTVRAEYLNEQYKKLKDKIEEQLEYGIAKGGLVIKPYIVMQKSNDDDITINENESPYKIEFDFVQADGFFPLAFDGSGSITEAAFVQRKTDKDIIYNRLEYHKYENGKVTVINKAYKTNSQAQMVNLENAGALGKPINLTDVPEWADIEPEVTINGVNRLLFAYFKMPQANTIDTYSPLGVSAFSRATSLIEQADKQYSRIIWECEGGELAIDIDKEALRDIQVSDGVGGSKFVSRMGKLQERLYRPVDLNQENTYNVFSPALRDASLLNVLNNYLMRIEDVVGISRGTLSDVAAEARTATEIKVLKQRSYQFNAKIQKALEKALKDVIYIMNVYCTLYEITPEGEYEASFEWDDSILTDVDTELNTKLGLMQQGLMGKVELRMWYFGETERQAREALAKIDEENRQAMENNMMAQMAMAGGGEAE